MASYLGTGTNSPGDVYTTGKIGIGTSSPCTALDVVGYVRVGGVSVIDSGGYLKPRTSSIAAAACNSIFISSSDAMLYFKDSGGQEYKLCG
jgi:hypothetical protein